MVQEIKVKHDHVWAVLLLKFRNPGNATRATKEICSARPAETLSGSCTYLLMFPRTFAWLGNLVTGDEKWVLYVNHTRKKQWRGRREQSVSTPKPDLQPLQWPLEEMIR
ncbi:unnamed protein product [Bursaphelenchus okinawaensis]|uniref:Uncharacterized protein n=1 Tax=Bursaphelenchus okinawaensis TaxID=465554 RepID=A0A811L7Z7_9BILA|nr:unnamed protein product [Bursaphelenchus okinawaensis]CAG9118923.1 unnamed protein product [Bursaphelenchus okinawaensis]